MRVVGDSGIEFDLDDTVATSMVSSGHLSPVDPDAVAVTLDGNAAAPGPVDEARIAQLEDRIAALEQPAEVTLADGTTPEVGADGTPVLTGTAEQSADSGEQHGEVADGEPETGPATDEAQDILHDTKPEPKRTRARKPATDES